MKVLVTGAAGFIGSHVVTALRTRGAEVVSLSRPGGRRTDDAVSTAEADYADASAMAMVFESHSPSALVHAAWRLAPGAAYLDDVSNVDDLRASLELFRVAAENGCNRIVGIGTCLEYAESDAPTTEEAPLAPTSLYAAAKAALFLTAREWARTARVSFAWARLYYPYGPREAEQRLIPSVTNALLRGERVETTHGRQRRSFVYVDDVAEAIAAIALSRHEGAFNVAAADALAIRDLLERLVAIVGRRGLLDVGARPARPNDPIVLSADISRLTNVVGWTPATSLDEGLNRTVEWWRRHHVSEA